MKRIVALALVAGFVATGLSSTAAAVEPSSQNGSATIQKLNGKNAIYRLGACLSNTELDCIEDFGVIESSEGQEKFISGTQLSYDPAATGRGQHQQLIYGSDTKWSIPTTEGPIEMGLTVELWSNKTHIATTIFGDEMVGGALFAYLYGRDSDMDTRYFVKVRSSWFKPENFTLHAHNAGFSEQKIPGGTLWTFSGSRVISANYNWENQAQYEKALRSKAPADYETNSLHFLGHHMADGKKLYTSFFNNPCSDKGYMVQANNAAGGGMAYWDSQTRSLNFSIGAAHRTMDGKLNKGFYRMWVNRAYLQCMWPESGLANAKAFNIGVYNEDGSKQVATTLVAMRKDLLTVAAYNFHYSAPQIRLGKAKAKASKLHCVSISDELKVKKVQGKKCPTGYKKFG